MAIDTVWGVVLAAGQGRRFGSHKLLASFRGSPLAAHAFRVTSEAVATGLLDGAVAVCAAGDHAIISLASGAGLETLEHDGTTMSSSLQAGLRWLAARPELPGAAMIVLGDQPLVQLAHLQAILASAARHPAPICRPRYRDTPQNPGHPVLLRQSAWAAMLGVDGDRGLRDLIASGGIELHLCDLPGSCPDVDTPEDLIALEAAH